MPRAKPFSAKAKKEQLQLKKKEKREEREREEREEKERERREERERDEIVGEGECHSVERESTTFDELPPKTVDVVVIHEEEGGEWE